MSRCFLPGRFYRNRAHIIDSLVSGHTLGPVSACASRLIRPLDSYTVTNGELVVLRVVVDHADHFLQVALINAPSGIGMAGGSATKQNQLGLRDFEIFKISNEISRFWLKSILLVGWLPCTDTLLDSGRSDPPCYDPFYLNSSLEI